MKYSIKKIMFLYLTEGEIWSLGIAKALLCQPPKPIANTNISLKLEIFSGIVFGSTNTPPSPWPMAPLLLAPHVKRSPWFVNAPLW